MYALTRVEHGFDPVLGVHVKGALEPLVHILRGRLGAFGPGNIPLDKRPASLVSDEKEESCLALVVSLGS